MSTPRQEVGGQEVPAEGEWDQLWYHLDIATMSPDLAAKSPSSDPAYGLIKDAVLATAGDRIAFVGPRESLKGPLEAAARRCHDGAGGLMTPGLIDCHTHLVYGGDRAGEFEARLRGVSYEALARAGGGILSTVRATRAAEEAELLHAALGRVDRLQREGVTTIEVKSGYGLTVVDELKQLRVATELGRLRPIDVQRTFLGAHTCAPEHQGDRGAYLDEVCTRQLPAVVEAGLADAVDIFCEGVGFSLTETRRLFEAASRAGLPVKVHAEQLSLLGGAALATEYRALSADHLEYLDQAGVEAMAAAGTVAVLLPGAFYTLRERQLPPIEALRAAGVPIALASDLNPGSSPICSLLLILNMGCTLFRLTPAEALAAVTVNGARALGLEDRGQLKPGLLADLALWSEAEPAKLAYQVGLSECRQLVKRGEVVPG